MKRISISLDNLELAPVIRNGSSLVKGLLAIETMWLRLWYLVAEGAVAILNVSASRSISPLHEVGSL
jgi:hypothetical protein